MIQAKHLTKNFDEVKALNDLSLKIEEDQVFGLVGTNGAGKSTFLNLAAGVFRPTSGSVSIDGLESWDNPKAKERFCYVSDDPYFFPNGTPTDMEKYYLSMYPFFDRTLFVRLMHDLDLNPKRRIATFSKGMKKQLAIVLGICTQTRYLLLDETFDGLDPVMRQAVKSLFAEEMDRRGLTPVIASHSLRELEDICDHVGLLHKGGLILSEDLNEMKLGILKLQCVFKNAEGVTQASSHLKVLTHETHGRLHVFTVKASREEVEKVFRNIPTVFFEILPLTLEEVFIAETEGAGYDVRSLIIH